MIPPAVRHVTSSVGARGWYFPVVCHVPYRRLGNRSQVLESLSTSRAEILVPLDEDASFRTGLSTITCVCFNSRGLSNFVGSIFS